MKKQLNSAAATMSLGEKIAQYLQAGDVLVLNGDLGAGKTTFTKGLAKGLHIPDLVRSPTFTIIREYHDGRLPLYHMDVYRLEEGGAEDLGLDEYFDGDGVCVVEWAQFAEDELPDNYLSLSFRRTDRENERVVEIQAHGQHFQDILEHLS